MKKYRVLARRWLRAALLAALLLVGTLPAALTEDAANEAWQAEPEVGPAVDAGNAGLTVEYEEPPAELADGEDALGEGLYLEEAGPDGEIVYGDEPLAGELLADGDAVASADDPDAPESGLEILAVPVIAAGYVAVAPEAPVYADAARTQAIGTFPEGATAYAEPADDAGSMLKLRFDTDETRGWNGDILTGYAQVEDVLAYNEEETAALVAALASDARTRYWDGVAIPCAVFSAVDYSVLAGEDSVGLNVTAHTQAEIQAFVNAHPAYRNQLNIYSVAASDAPYAAGKLSAVNQQSALNMVNQLRYIAGLGADLSLLSEQEEAMGMTALVLRLYSEQYKAQNGKDVLTHYPGRAAAIADASYDSLYATGYSGAGHSNIAMGYTVTSALLAYMSDSDDTNAKTVGHRRWILNPTMGQTVFGANGRFSAMYAHDLSGSGGQTKVAWPAQEMPLQYFSAKDPWSVSFGRALSADKVSVTLVRVGDGKVWSFSSAAADGDFYVENSAYGQKGCVIFRPSGLDAISEGDTFNVSVADGASGELTRYTVRFFSLDLTACNPLDTLTDVTAVKTWSGNELAWSAASGAQGYYVCRRASNESYYQIVADVAATAYRDTAVSADADYYYQVYAHDASRTSRSAVSVEAKPIEPESVTLSASGTVTLYRNATLQLSVGFAPANAMAKLTWKSSKTKYATVDANGLVTPVKKGTTIISVTTDNGKQASVKVKVVNPPSAKKVNLSASGTVTLNVGETLQLSGSVEPAQAEQKLSWRTNKSKVASVAGSGLVTALTPGTATITAKATNGKSAKVKIQVVDPYAPASVVLSASGTVTLKIGETLKLNATVLPDTAQTTLAWTSSKKKVASVDGEGNVTALRRGTATITVKTANGKKAKVKVKVVK